MKNTTHRVIILKNVDSEIISQAILILKGTDGICEDSVLREAENVVAKYMRYGKRKRCGKYTAIVSGITIVLGLVGMFLLKLV